MLVVISDAPKSGPKQAKTGPAHKRSLAELKALGSSSGARVKKRSIRPLCEKVDHTSKEEPMVNDQVHMEQLFMHCSFMLFGTE